MLARVGTYVLWFRLVLPFDQIASQADDVTGFQTAIPFDTHTVPQHHTHTSCAVTHLQLRLDRESESV